jgi:hypothetical protein
VKRELHGVIGHPDLVRDPENRAVISVDKKALDKYKSERQELLKQQQIFREHEDLKRDVHEIKSMLARLVKEIENK